MLEALQTLVTVLIAGLLAEIIATRRRRKGARTAQSTFAAGSEVAVVCALRACDDNRPGWRIGKLHLTPGRASWTPRFRKRGSIVINPAVAHIMDTRPVILSETWRIHPNLAIIALNLQGSRLEIGVFPEDLDTVRRVFELPDSATR